MSVSTSNRSDAARWDEWQRGNAASSRRSTMQVRVVASLMFAGVAGWLTLALLAAG